MIPATSTPMGWVRASSLVCLAVPHGIPVQALRIGAAEARSKTLSRWNFHRIQSKLRAREGGDKGCMEAAYGEVQPSLRAGSRTAGPVASVTPLACRV